jgi:hypothetical protein
MENRFPATPIIDALAISSFNNWSAPGSNITVQTE